MGCTTSAQLEVMPASPIDADLKGPKFRVGRACAREYVYVYVWYVVCVVCVDRQTYIQIDKQTY